MTSANVNRPLLELIGSLLENAKRCHDHTYGVTLSEEGIEIMSTVLTCEEATALATYSPAFKSELATTFAAVKALRSRISAELIPG